MGGFDFEWNGKVYDVVTEGGYPFFDNDEEREAFEQWRQTPQGIQVFGPVPTDWSKEHYLDDRYPWNTKKLQRIDIDDPDAKDVPYVNWPDYVECEYGCKKHFYITKSIHVCSYCNGPSCKKCAKRSFLNCSEEGCNKWNCSESGVVAPYEVNGNWHGHVNIPCNGKSKDKCHHCRKECAHCGTASGTAKRCSRCKHSFYCNMDCQKANFKQHKKGACKSVAAQNELQKLRDTARVLNDYE